MSDLQFKQGDETWKKLRHRCKTDLYFLADVILGYGKHIPMRKHAHGLLCHLAQAKTGCPEIDSAPVAKLLLPRKWGKTSIITVSRTIQRLINDPNCSILLANEKSQSAEDFLGEIKGHFMRNELFRALFPEILPPIDQENTWSATRINVTRTTTRKDPSVFVIGVGGTVTGMHPDYIDVDDMISREAAENARRGSWQIMEEVNRWTHTLWDLLSGAEIKGHRITFTGTRWFFNDCYDHITDYFGDQEDRAREWQLTFPVEDGQKQTMKITRRGRMVEYRRSKIEEGRPSWPERWDAESMAAEQAGDPILFSCNALNEPASEANATFKGDWLKTYTWLDSYTLAYVNPQGLKVAIQLQQLDITMIVDPGGFSKGKLSTGDRARAAFWVIGHTPTGEFLLLDCWSEKDTYITAQKQIVNRAIRFRPRKIGIENAGQQIVFIDQTRRLLTAPIPEGAALNLVVEEVKTEGKHKDDRILALEPYFQRGLMYIGTGAVFTEFRTQYTQFPRTVRRDLLDALAYLPKLVRQRNSQSGTNSIQTQKRAELDAYYRKRGIPIQGR